MCGSSGSCPRCVGFMKKFAIIVNAWKDRNLDQTRKLCSYIETHGGSCRYLISVDEQEGIRKVRAADIPKGTECILVLGGDGTLIRAARDTVECGIPLIGVNMGTLGYLCELEVNSVYDAVDEMMHDQYMVEKRMMLSGLKSAQAEAEAVHALNDIVIHRTGALSLVSLTVYVNGQYLNTFKGDGMIVSTPTGSTGYNMSAGGPIVDPKAELLLLTPINSHTLTPRSIVIDSQDEIVVEVGSRRLQQDEAVEVSFDGDRGCRLGVGECIRIWKAEECAKILKFSRISFLEILRKKMQTFH